MKITLRETIFSASNFTIIFSDSNYQIQYGRGNFENHFSEYATLYDNDQYKQTYRPARYGIVE